MDIRYSKNTERPVAEIVKEQFSLAINKAAGEYDRNLTDIVLTTGDEYKVKHNGSEYTCTAWAEDGKVHIGGKGEPFDIYNFAGDIYAMALQDGHNRFEVYHEKLNGLPYEAMPAGYPGVKTEMVEIVPEQSVTHVRLVGDRYQAGFKLPIEGGKDYVVVINGTKYQCVSTEGGTIGNNTTQYPFIFRSDIDSQYWSAELGSPITLEIYEPEIVTPIDSKYIPNIAYFKAIDNENLVCVNMTFKEAADHIVSGNPLTCIVMNGADGQFLNATSLTVEHVRDSGLITFTVLYSTSYIPTYVWNESGKIREE